VIKILSAYFHTTLLQISPLDTPLTLQDRLQALAQDNYTFDLMECQTGRVLPPDEVLIDHREYYAVFTNLPTEILPINEKLKTS
jgi:hypothetical protein